ncbi:DsrE/DsrF/DrsH-like family protein [Belnapia rosea]|uniref:DsrE/DsrF/DrsH-like family protein n=1 Tax=Belnapia rosea TaxID=938405 RepID=UPI00088363AD|nr:DsrE/DsrF/DrsH-like family protein [Belnapia rosea]SDB72665.1 Peroxiredoxin family protein [Belnapia rosea]
MGKPLGILLISGGHERAHYALVLATGAAALGREVTLFATNAGCRLLLADSALARDPREAEVTARGVAGIGILLEAAEELGLHVLACEAGLRAEGLEAAPLRPGVTVAGVASFLAAVGDGQMVTL